MALAKEGSSCSVIFLVSVSCHLIGIWTRVNMAGTYFHADCDSLTEPLGGGKCESCMNVPRLFAEDESKIGQIACFQVPILC
jgi:hypothetical protein